MTLEEVPDHARIQVFMEVDDYGALIFGDPQGILSQQFLLRPIDVFKIIKLIILILIKLHY